MRTNEVPKMTHPPKSPSVCTKPNCKGSRFIFHEDGWQCLNCMKIIYRDAPLPYIANNHPERVGSYNSKGALDLKNEALEALNDGCFCHVEIDQNNDFEHNVAAGITVIDSDFSDWFIEHREPSVIFGINKFTPAE